MLRWPQTQAAGAQYDRAMTVTLEQQRKLMVDLQLKARGIRSAAVLRAMGRVHREAFVPRELRAMAYEDQPLDIGSGQTISQPLMVAMMTEALDLKGGEKVLEIGTGSGYAAAVLAEIAGEVFTIERHRRLAERAMAALAAEGYGNVHVVVGDGTRGLPEAAPFDGITVTAGGPRVPESLKAQLAVGGRMVIPVGSDRTYQELLVITRTGTGPDDFTEESLCPVRFVPLVGEEGWQTGNIF